jgi:hypothetical protein
MSQLSAGMAWSSLPWLSSLGVPTLVVHGDADHFVPVANGIQIARLIPDSRLHVLGEEGHFSVFDPESDVHSLLQDFFSSDSLAASTAWSSGVSIDDDATVEAGFVQSVGAQPYSAFSDAFRWFVAASNGNGNGRNGANGSYAEGSSPASRSRA